MFIHQSFVEKRYFFCYVKIYKKCHVNSNFVAPKIVLFTQATKIVFVSRNMVSEHKISRCTPRNFSRNLTFKKTVRASTSMSQSGFPALITFLYQFELRPGVFDNNILSSIEKNQLEFYKHETIIPCVTTSTIDKSPSNIPT
jgi:hypothetical protein